MTRRVLVVLMPVQVVADSSLPLEERMRLLSDRFAAVLQDQLAQDKAITDLQEQLQASRKEVDAGGWDPGSARPHAPRTAAGSQGHIAPSQVSLHHLAGPAAGQS